ncbi:MULTISPECIES: IS110 family transposase [Pseudoalteromonas]|jgi:transposase|uniref:IS110 family transposase n=1 Tax=Pseudoalteromonas TaxID=53246 RepID=UPI0003F99C59|nr:MULTISPECIES: IS110 family transposase [unclassified Pseudoalteromonas]MBB1340008.1 IS110 family transposase [Pseudoalteromonas sp. SR44-2]MBH0091276.1 IS110 family transposase [Pseudoalteromonas sp. NSLLW218]
MKAFIGIDVGKEKLDISWLRDVVKSKKKTKIFKNNPKGYQELVAWLIKNTNLEAQDIVITTEPTGVYSEPLMYFLYEQGFILLHVNPGKAKQYASSLGLVHKTDKSDATMLARYGHDQQHSLLSWQPEPVEARELKVMTRRLEALEQDLRREENRYEAVGFSGASTRVTQSIEDMIAVLKTEMGKLKNDIDEHIDRHPQLKKNRQLLQSIKGVGEVISRMMVSLMACKQFKNAKQLACYLGLIPKLNESGKRAGKTTLSKEGPGYIRAKLYMAAVVAVQHNPDIKAQNKRLVEQGKTKMQAIGAAMRKLTHICFGVVKNQTEYQPQAI